MKAKAAAIFLAILLAVPLSVRADTIFNSFGPGDAFGPLGVRISGSDYGSSLAIAAPFTPASNYLFGAASFPFRSLLDSNQDAFDVWLMSNSNGLPDAMLESFMVSVPSESPSIYTVYSTAHTLLAGGTTYWLKVLPHYSYSSGGWNKNLLGLTGYAYVFGDGSWGFDPEPTPAFRVEGSIVPEPSTFALLGIGIVGLMALKARCKTR